MQAVVLEQLGTVAVLPAKLSATRQAKQQEQQPRLGTPALVWVSAPVLALF
jgi:hypothetical protein